MLLINFMQCFDRISAALYHGLFSALYRANLKHRTVEQLKEFTGL